MFSKETLFIEMNVFFYGSSDGGSTHALIQLTIPIRNLRRSRMDQIKMLGDPDRQAGPSIPPS